MSQPVRLPTFVRRCLRPDAAKPAVAALLLAIALAPAGHAQGSPDRRMTIEHPTARWYAVGPAWRGVETSLITADGGALQRAFPFLAGASPHIRIGCSTADRRAGNALIVEVRFAGAGHAINAAGAAERAYVDGTRALLSQPGRLKAFDRQGRLIDTIELTFDAGVLKSGPVSDAARSALMNAHALRIETPSLDLLAGAANLRESFPAPALRAMPCIDTRFN
jgi:hypothetical protein